MGGRLDPITLVRAIPASIGVRDPEAQRVLQALTEAIRYLVTSRSSDGTPTPVEAAAATILGESPISVVALPNNVFRISFTGSTGGGSLYFGDKSIDLDGVTFELENDESAPGNNKVYGTDGSGDRGWKSDPSVTAEDPGASITTIGAGSEGSETASTDTWTAGGSNGLAEWYVSRVVYDDTGDEIVYAFLRKRTYDKYGRLYSVSGETRVSIDATVVES